MSMQRSAPAPAVGYVLGHRGCPAHGWSSLPVVIVQCNHRDPAMHIRFGYELLYSTPVPTHMILMLNTHLGRGQTYVIADKMQLSRNVPLQVYTDGFGNTCTRLELPVGPTRITADAMIEDSGAVEPVALAAREHPVRELPFEVLQFLLSSRYCDTEVLMAEAWRLFGHLPPGWNRVQAICDFVHQHVAFDYRFARPTRTASETYFERQGVCRDFAHLAIALCRCLNIPARYCTGYLGDIGVPAVEAPMDFAGCMEVYLGGQWHLFDPRNNQRRIGRILIARGRDAGDVAISTAFGPACLQLFKVWTDQADGQEFRRVG
jgi:transglutaminase-like putative cysteine protease